MLRIKLGTDNENQWTEWKIGEPRPHLESAPDGQPSDALTIQASGEELDVILTLIYTLSETTNAIDATGTSSGA